LSGAIRFDQLPEMMFKSHNYPIEVMHSLDTAIRTSDSEKIARLVEQIVNILEVGGNTPFYSRAVYFNAVNLLITGVSQRMGDDNRTVQEIGARIMLRSYTIAEMIDIIKSTANQLQQVLHTNQGKSGLTDILEYIDGHINSFNLSLQSVANEFGMSASAFSKMFKEKAGLNYKEYIDSLRLSRAKDMLKNSNIQIEQIASEVGYESVTSFYRLFKKNIGIAPGEYRQAAEKLHDGKK
jgi:YesN/AraC family two-component response regulator